MNGGERDETRTVRRLHSIRHEVGLMGMMDCRDGELELVREAHHVVEVDRLVAVRLNLEVVYEALVINKWNGCQAAATLTRPRKTSTNASHWKSSGNSPSPAHSPLVAFVQ